MMNLRPSLQRRLAGTAIIASGLAVWLVGCGADRETALAPSPDVVVLMQTSMGDIRLRLFPDRSPITVGNFLSYVDDGSYDGTIFHRLIESFMIQGGGYTTDFTRKKTRKPIKNEADNGLSNKRGTLSMARTNLINSATCQFFINVVDNSFLDHHGPREFGYAVFGEVVQGMDVVDRIRAVETGANGPFTSDCPLENVVIQSVSRVE